MTTPMTDRFAIPNQDPEFKYRFVNSKDMHALGRIYEGWEPVTEKEHIPPEVAKVIGQIGGNPDGGSVVRRGDLILMRMRREKWEETVARPKREARERQAASLDSMVAQANENARRRAREAGQKNIPVEMVFQTSDDNQFPGATKAPGGGKE